MLIKPFPCPGRFRYKDKKNHQPENPELVILIFGVVVFLLFAQLGSETRLVMTLEIIDEITTFQVKFHHPYIGGCFR